MPSDPGPLRVLLACDWFVKYAAGLARGLADAGCEVALLTRGHDREFGRRPGAMRAFVDATLEGRASHLVLEGRVREPTRIAEFVALRSRVRAFRPDVVHVQDSIVHDPRLALVCGLRPRRWAVTAHDITVHPGDPVPRTRIALTRRLLRRHAALAFVHSQQLARDLAATDSRTGPIAVVPHGVGGQVEAPLPQSPSLLFFGRISHYKGLDTLLAAMPEVWRHLPELTLVIAGRGALPDDPLLEDPRIILRHEHVPDDELAELFAGSTCVVLPYREASQSGVGSQARQHGRAIVSTSVGALSELVDPAAGRIVPPEDPPALAAALVEVVGTPGLAESMGRAASAWVGEAGWESVARLTVEAYRRYGLA